MADPSPPFKGLIQIETTKGTIHGWSESFWINQPTFEESLVALTEIAERRAALMPAMCQIVGLRVTHPKLYRASRFTIPNLKGTFGDEDDGMAPFTCLRLRLAGGNYNTTQRIKGIPRSMVRETAYLNDLAWQSAFILFTATVKRYCVLVNKPHGPKGETAAESVVNPIQEITILRMAPESMSRPHFVPRGRRRSRKSATR